MQVIIVLVIDADLMRMALCHCRSKEGFCTDSAREGCAFKMQGSGMKLLERSLKLKPLPSPQSIKSNVLHLKSKVHGDNQFGVVHH